MTNCVGVISGTLVGVIAGGLVGVGRGVSVGLNGVSVGTSVGVSDVGIGVHVGFGGGVPVAITPAGIRSAISKAMNRSFLISPSQIQR